jgi:hypothetical protein
VTERDVQSFDGENWTKYLTSDRLLLARANGIAVDRQGTKWFAIDGGVSRLDDNGWKTYTTVDGLLSNGVLDVAVDSSNNIWFGTVSGISMFDGRNWTNYTTADGKNLGRVGSLAVDPWGEIWCASGQSMANGGRGVFRFDGENWTPYSPYDGLSSNAVHDIAIDMKGNPVFGTDSGVSRLILSNRNLPPKIPQALKATIGNGEISLSWRRNLDPDLYYYKIYRNQGGAFSAEDSVKAILKPDTTWTDGGLVDGEVYFYAVSAVDSTLSESVRSDSIAVTYAAGLDEGTVVPVEFSLSQNYPNPFNAETTIKFALPEQCPVTIRVFNINGQLIRTLTDYHLPAGHHRVRWDGTDNGGGAAASGVYFYIFRAGEFNRTRRMVLLK